MPTSESCQAGWAALVAEQVRQHSRLFFRLAYGIVLDKTAAEDACQAALLKALSLGRQKLQDPARLRAWISRVVVNEALCGVRRRRLERRTFESCNQDGHERITLSAAPALDLRESLLIAMDQLPETTRTVVALRVMQGMSGNEVKNLLGCSASEVSRQLHAGMEQLRHLLADWSDTVNG